MFQKKPSFHFDRKYEVLTEKSKKKYKVRNEKKCEVRTEKSKSSPNKSLNMFQNNLHVISK